MTPAYTIALVAGLTYSPLIVTGIFWKARQVQFVIAALVFAALAIVFYAAAGQWIWSALWICIGALGLWLLRSALRLAEIRRESAEFDRLLKERFRG